MAESDEPGASEEPGVEADPNVEADVAAEPAQSGEAEVEAQERAAERVEAEPAAEEAEEELAEAAELVDDEPAAEPEPEPPPEPEPELLHGAPVTWSRGQTVLHPSREDYVELVSSLRTKGWWSCVDLCGVDYLGYGADRDLPPGTSPERFEVVVSLLNHTERSRVRVRVQVPEHDPQLPTLFGVHPAVDYAEREVFDMFGITFDGHPDMTRILMPDEWEGHPLRKDDEPGRIPVQFKGTTSAR
jgi:NADH-quinone oxidoreductase subunit C